MTRTKHIPTIIIGALLHLFPLIHLLICRTIEEKKNIDYSLMSVDGKVIFDAGSVIIFSVLLCLFAALVVTQWKKDFLKRALIGLAISCGYIIYLLISNRWLYWVTQYDTMKYVNALPCVWIAVLLYHAFSERAKGPQA